MNLRIRAKYWFLSYYWLVLAFVSCMSILALVYRGGGATTYLGVLGTTLSLFYFIQKQKLEELKLFREIFAECNARYAEITPKLESILICQKSELNKEQEYDLVMYFNLCAEEYLYYSRGYIDPLVWEAWRNGILDNFKNRKIRAFWETEKASHSYYGLDL